ncbi:YcaO-like family protein [Pseudonocardia sp. HH130630-07]|uniref:YcaO-like family protein n=1 Tax=Pseudonocardia sp. HH130630-07 TaxID=1690815 RepID=UPI000B1DC15A|nr:YcaO-like family protein [Pseudonocardia sp. HH130630-07]
MPITDVDAPQDGERAHPLAEAHHHALAAVAALGLTAELTPVPAARPGLGTGAWHCVLHRDGVALEYGRGSGKGADAAARVGAVYEALEHHLGCVPDPRELVLRTAHEVAVPADAGDALLALLAEGPDRPLACLPHRSLTGGADLDVPAFVSMPGYLLQPPAVRAAAGDTYDYGVVARYSTNNGWAAGRTPDEAVVHALNEIVERDAMSLLLVRQFLADPPGTLSVLDPATLPGGLAELHATAERVVGTRVWLLDMTTDLGVPAYWAYVAPTPGQPSRFRGCGASLSPRYAVERALYELVQCHSGLHATPSASGTEPVRTAAYPALHRCYLADLSDRLPGATRVPFAGRETPGTPRGHRDRLLDLLAGHGHQVWAREQYVGEHLAVVTVHVPGLERFMIVGDDEIVVPGARGRAAARR